MNSQKLREFYDLCQAYRHTPIKDIVAVGRAYEALIDFVNERELAGFSLGRKVSASDVDKVSGGDNRQGSRPKSTPEAAGGLTSKDCAQSLPPACAQDGCARPKRNKHGYLTRCDCSECVPLTDAQDACNACIDSGAGMTGQPKKCPAHSQNANARPDYYLNGTCGTVYTQADPEVTCPGCLRTFRTDPMDASCRLCGEWFDIERRRTQQDDARKECDCIFAASGHDSFCPERKKSVKP